MKCKSFLNIYSFCKKNLLIIKIYSLKLLGKLSNLVLKVLEAPNKWYT